MKKIFLLFLIVYSSFLSSQNIQNKQLTPIIAVKINVLSDAKVSAIVKTNLPDNMSFSVVIRDEFTGYGAVKAKVLNGKIIIPPFEKPLANGSYYLELSSHFFQPEDVLSVVGVNGQYLAGSHVKEIFGKGILFRHDFEVALEGNDKNLLANLIQEEKEKLYAHFITLMNHKDDDLFFQAGLSEFSSIKKFDGWHEYALKQKYAIPEKVSLSLISRYDVAWYWLIRIAKDFLITEGFGTGWTDEKIKDFEKLAEP